MAGVFLLGSDNNTVVQMKQADYLDEDDIQRLIAVHPALLAGSTGETEAQERPLLLIKREMGVPDGRNGNDRWFLDHLFVDSQAIPTLVEVKQLGNPDMRRRIIGQMMDYAANGPQYWSLETIKDSFARQHKQAAQESLESFVDGTEFEDTEAFWAAVEENLREGKIRMVFAADSLPSELKRLIEFMNKHMKEIDVLGVELRQFKSVDESQRIVAPSVVGWTSEAALTKARRVRSGERKYPELDEIAEEFRRVSGGRWVSNHNDRYRQIKLGPGLDNTKIHYEFLKVDKEPITCDFHVEGERVPGLAEAMKTLASSLTKVGGADLQYIEHRGRSGTLRVVPTDPEDHTAVARTMLGLIEATEARLYQAAQAARQGS